MSSTEAVFLASMIDCSDRRQIRIRYAVPHELGTRGSAGEARDPLADMVACDDPRQVRFREEHSHRAGAAVA